MCPIIFIDPGYGKDWKFTGGERINSKGNPANPYAKISFRGENCTAFCTGGTGGGFLQSIDVGYECQQQCKFSVYCKDMASGGAFHMGLATTQTATSPNYFGITINNGGSYNITFPITPSSGTLTGNLSDGYHNISLMLYESRTATTYTHTYRMAVDDKLVYGTKSGLSAIPVLYLGAWFPPPEAGKFFISNIIVAKLKATSSSNSCDKQVIPPNTQLMPLKMGEPEDISFEHDEDTGEYVGYETGDKLLQTIDATDLINGNEAANIKSYGEGAKVAAVVLYGNPGYRTTEFNKFIYSSFDGKRSSYTAVVTTKQTATCCIEVSARDHTLGEINGKLAGWEIG